MIKLLTILSLLIFMACHKNKNENEKTEVLDADCSKYYYGVGIEQDYAKARKCLETSEGPDATPLLLLIYINGDGVERNYDKALEIWSDSVEKSGFEDATMRYLYTIITNRIQNPKELKELKESKEYKRLEYWDIAMTTVDMNLAVDIKLALERQAAEKKKLATQKSMSSEQKKYFESIENDFKGILTNEASRYYTMHIDGTMRTSMSQLAKASLREGHQNRIHDFIINRKYPNFSEEDFLQFDQELNSAYKYAMDISGKIFLDQIEFYKDDEGAVSRYRKYTDEIKNNLKISQRNWIRYRDNWVLLVDSLNPDSDSEALSTSIKAELTRSRIEEIKDSVDFFDGL